MIGRFIFGMVSGGVLVAGGLIVGAVLFPLPGTDLTANTEVEATSVEKPADVAVTELEAEPEPEPVAEPEPMPEVVVEAPAEAPAEVAAESPAAEASSIEAPAELAAEVEAEAPAAVAVTEPVVVEMVPETAAEEPSGSPAKVVVASEAAKAPAAKAVAAPLADAPATEVAAEPSAEPAAVAEIKPEPEPAPVLVPEPEPEPEPAAEPVADAVPAIVAEVPATDPPLMPGTRSKPLPETDGATPPDVGSVPEVAPAPGPSLEPTPGFDDTPDGVVVGRLPKIGDAPVTAAEAAAEAEAAAPEAAFEEAPPILAFAAPFENPDNKPVLAVVLIDVGGANLDRASLAALPFPVSFALDPLDPATPERAALYRAAGREVVMLATGIAYSAQAADVEVAFQSMALGLPEAVAVMDLATPMFQNQRPLASIVVPVVAAQGRGLLTWDHQGLNAADQVARREDVAAAVIFRDLASSGTDGAAIRRLLDRAVFKAGQDGRVVVAGTATTETVAALLEWSVEGRAATIALGPLTAAMQVD